jgi:hypothetical protein
MKNIKCLLEFRSNGFDELTTSGSVQFSSPARPEPVEGFESGKLY